MLQGVLYNIQRMSVQDGPGLRTTVFFKGCPLACRWCSNPESQTYKPETMRFANLCLNCGACLEVCPSQALGRDEAGRIFWKRSACENCGQCAEVCPAQAQALSGARYTVAEVLDKVRKDAPFYSRSGGGVTFSGGECTMQGEFLLALLEACHADGLHCCVDTCGQTEPGLFARVLDEADLLLFDIKHTDSATHKELVGAGNELIQKNLRQALEKAPEKLRIRVPLMPGLNDSEANIAAMAKLLLPYGIDSLDVLPCHNFASSKYAALALANPAMPEYEPEALDAVLGLFAAHGLATEIV